VFCDNPFFIIQRTQPFSQYTMVCDSCGHPNSEHKSVTFSMFYCSSCKKIESSVSFSVDPAGNSSDTIDPSKSDDVLTDMYKSFRGLRH
ncbi:MAG TPA: hypothetical protein VLA68_05655, partial [Nitrososphaera sp.]|nr:hypothetical protein [Nitrososphaera sp.]